MDLMTMRRAPRPLSMLSSRISLRNCSRTVTDCVTTPIRASSLPVPTLAMIKTSLMNTPSMLCVTSSAVRGCLPFPGFTVVPPHTII